MLCLSPVNTCNIPEACRYYYSDTFLEKRTGKGLVFPKTAREVGFLELEKCELEKCDVADTYCSYMNKYSATSR